MKRLAMICLAVLPIGVLFYFTDIYTAAVIGR